MLAPGTNGRYYIFFAIVILIIVVIAWIIVGAKMIHGAKEQYVNMTVYPKTLSFCYIVKHLEDGEKVDSVECNYVDMSNHKLKTVRDYLDNYSNMK